MSEKIIIAGLAVLVVGMLGYMATSGRGDAPQSEVVSNGIHATLYKSPTCGCCGQYGNHLVENGYEVETKMTTDMGAIKAQFDVPYELESCHTVIIDDYVVEGHVPEAAIAKLLAEKPDIKGIGMAGMPSGSPGMPGPKADFMIYTIEHDGSKGKLFMQL